MRLWSSLPPNMSTTARGLSVSMTSRTWVNQLKTSGRSSPLAMRPSIASAASTARLPATARRSDSPGTTTSESPAIQTPSLRLGVNLTRSAGVSGAVTGGVFVGGGCGVATAVSISSSFSRPRADLSVLRGRSRKTASLTLSSGPVTASATSRFQPSGWIVADLCSPGAFRNSAIPSPVSETTIAEPADCRRRPPSAVRGRGRRWGGSRVSIRTGSR